MDLLGVLFDSDRTMRRFVIVAGTDMVLVANTPHQLLRIEGFVGDPCPSRELERWHSFVAARRDG